MSEKEFVIVSSDVLPEVVLKVLEAKRLLAQGICRTSTEACREVGVSRSAYYKYKDSAFIYSEKMNERIVTFCIVLSDRPGLLAEVARFNDAAEDLSEITRAVLRISGVASAKVISGK